jgi:hypothetical protein
MNTRIYSSISSTRAVASFLRFLDHTQRRSTTCRTALDERSARRRDLYLTTHSTHKRQTSLLPAGFEPTIATGERPHNNVFRSRGHWDRCSSINFVIKRVVHIAVNTFFEFQRNTRPNAVIKTTQQGDKTKSG